MNKHYHTLEFNLILDQLANLAFSQKAKEKALQLKPFLSERECNKKMQETASALKVIESLGTPPLASMPELNTILELSQKGFMLNPEQLLSICAFITSCKRMKNYLKRAEYVDEGLYVYHRSFFSLEELDEEISCAIRNGMVDSEASADLRGIRRKIETIHSAVKEKLESVLRNNKNWFEEGYVSVRNGRFVLPVKNKYRNQLEGSVIDKSNTGGTYFIEPAAIRKLQDELEFLQIEEENEVRKILYTLTALVDSYMNELKINIECMETLDFMFAKAKLAIEMKAISVPVTTERKLIMKQGRHPLLEGDKCIPLDLEIGGEVSGIVITGPNTGGKTVALKTVGLLSLMAQSGLHVPVAKGSLFCMHSNVLCDIGDGQSIAESLSTFSAHITNIIDILKKVSHESLVLLDELGSGTDPAEGMGIAISILAELKQRNCLFIATTHYPEIKEFAQNTEGLINARMEFDRESLKPLYKLQIGEAGESCALYIAKRLGFPEHMLARAEKEAYGRETMVNTAVNNSSDKILKEEDSKSQIGLTNKIKKDLIHPAEPSPSEKFQIGDSVKIYPEKELGIIYKKANDIGEFGVQIKGKKQLINHKRIKLLVPASELYPEGYDFSIVFDTKENRKARHDMERKYAPGTVIIHDEI
ncbi:endonuclease MutS2 [Clostridium aminobutyricum]|uniref:DNA mismatch repair protein MutS n=1 Tax=Clostridium aminobutyricum TaxID=33953 RepID=A0A939IJI4_CLOAM|nr:DNA mismatch repair protein MutS [Clostridium aminobutyricum]MBN7773638.1 DNA mismatch repair protein MutS [Clostridium aminobutyricum]